MIPLHVRVPPVFPEATRTCDDCQVASRDPVCWFCGQRLSEQSKQGPVSIRNPAGPLPKAVGTALIL